jgi:beta-galactosidase
MRPDRLCFLVMGALFLSLGSNLSAGEHGPDLVSAGTRDGQPQPGLEHRVRCLFDADWRFHLGDLAGSDPAFRDGDWRAIELPHDYSIEQGPAAENPHENGHFPGGIAWYRKHFQISSTDLARWTDLEFEGIYCDAQIWLNGHLLGRAREGYTSVHFPLQAFLRADADNVLAVRVANESLPNCRWYTGSGIYRHVWLTTTDPLHVATWGLDISTPEASAAYARVHVNTTIDHAAGGETAFELVSSIEDETGRELVRQGQTGICHAGSESVIRQDLVLSNPSLWSPDHPTHYRVRSRIRKNGVTVDDQVTSFGVRTFRFVPRQGFFLNGENLKFKGVCLHHDAGPVGAAVPDALWESRLRQLKQLGCNAIRLSHNPHAPALLDLCDQLGFLVMDELCDKWDAPYNRYVPADWEQDFRASVMRDRNHPSVIFWSVGNENGGPSEPFVAEGLQRFGDFVRKLDPARPVIAALERGKDEPVAVKCRELLTLRALEDAVLGCNYAEQWFPDLARLDPDLLFLGTESYAYYSTAPTNRGTLIEQNQWLSYVHNPSAIGSFMWVGFDYLGEGGKNRERIGSGAGLFDITGLAKPAAAFYQSIWRAEPLVSLAIREPNAAPAGLWGWPALLAHWNFAPGTQLELVTYTNCASVELLINDTSCGRQRLADFPNRIMTWPKLPYSPGTVRAIGRDANERIVAEYTLRTAGPAAGIRLEAEHAVLRCSTHEATIVTCTVVDAAGIPVPEANALVHFAVQGPGRILAIGNGNLDAEYATRIPFTDRTQQRTAGGRCRAIIQATSQPGTFSLVATSAGLAAAEIRISNQ